MMIRCAKCGQDIAPATWGVAPRGVICEACKNASKSRVGRVAPYRRCTRCGLKGHEKTTCKATDARVARWIYNRSQKHIEARDLTTKWYDQPCPMCGANTRVVKLLAKPRLCHVCRAQRRSSTLNREKKILDSLNGGGGKDA